jgi:phosphoadenosine phosphosulfate reductase
MKREEAQALDDSLEGLELPTILERVVGTFAPGKLAVSSAFGPGTMVVLHALHELGIRLPVIFIDTLHHFPETLEHVERSRVKYDLDLRVYRPCDTREEFEKRYGPRLWERDLDLYQQVSKVEPFQRATAGLEAWITGRRRHQSETRADLPIIDGEGPFRVNPLASWNRSEVWRYLLDNSVPYNPLHDLGYASVGDEPLTTAVSDGEGERAGRWRGTDRTECGIHSV